MFFAVIKSGGLALCKPLMGVPLFAQCNSTDTIILARWPRRVPASIMCIPMWQHKMWIQQIMHDAYKFAAEYAATCIWPPLHDHTTLPKLQQND